MDRLLAAGATTLLTPPSTTSIGVVLVPQVADLLLRRTGDSSGILLAQGVATMLSLPPAGAGFSVSSVAGGVLSIQWF